MRQLFSQLINDEAGFIIAAELLLVSTLVVIALVVGLSAVSRAVNHELNDVANAFGSINQSFQTQGQNGNSFQDQSMGGGQISDSAPQSEN